MPDIRFTMGALDYFNTPVPAQPDDYRRMGVVIGRQIVGLYIVEILLKRALVEEGIQPPHHHGLLELFRDLPGPKRQAAESKYQEILVHRVEDGWDFQKSVESFLEYLGNNPITDTRYFWDRPHTGPMSIIFLADALSPLIDALFIALHGYPQGGALTPRFNTRFRSLEDSMPATNTSQ